MYVESPPQNPYYHPEYHHYPPIKRNLDGKLLSELFPRTEGTPMSELVGEVLDLISPLCDTRDDGELSLIARGGWITRLIRGTPKNYWRITDIYNKLLHEPRSTELIGEGKLAHNIVEHLADGPDMDVMYLLKDGHTDEEVIILLSDWVKIKNEELITKGYQLNLETIPLSVWNGAEDTRIYSTLTLNKKSFKNENGWETVVRLDLGKEPKTDSECKYDSRLTGQCGAFDACSVAFLSPDNSGIWKLEIPADLVEIVRDRPNLIYIPIAIPVNKLVSVVRMLAQDVMNRDEPIASYYFRQGNGRRMHYDGWWNHPSLFGGTDFFMSVLNESRGDADVENAIKLREGDIAGWALLGTTANPFKWLAYADELGLGYIEHTALADVIPDCYTSDLLLRTMGKEFIKNFRNELVYSDIYRQHIITKLASKYDKRLSDKLDMKIFGLLLIIRSMIKESILDKHTPVTISTYLELVKPVIREIDPDMGDSLV